ncbi:hypothetical protein G647_03956 [Cladophialophora carrionii CBS 160.54]|uniref:Uncharacterized protein n=1 Tax=Cladophialophora carrionii CBS 160.54 TaxID=1279043 RepID=V9DF53_9EURO|nr:uncharacterized protein G647_03956 [Cladophialophora carrionii CBS 160.54]ETI24587.1 hypothetical protein G647_03956 [Cladophialophora carrionii CBS 160.54]
MALAAPAEWLYALATVSWSLTIAFNIYTTPIVAKIKSARDQAEIEQLAPEQYGKWTPTPKSLECTDYIAPGQDEGTVQVDLLWTGSRTTGEEMTNLEVWIASLVRCTAILNIAPMMVTTHPASVRQSEQGPGDNRLQPTARPSEGSNTAFDNRVLISWTSNVVHSPLMIWFRTVSC